MSTPIEQPLVDPGAAAAVKWAGVAVVLVALVLVALLYGWVAVLLGLVASFGTLMICIGAEAQGPREV